MTLFYNFGCFDHRIYIAAINLNADRTFLIADGELLYGSGNIAHQGFCRYKLGIYHSSSKTFTKHSEANVCNVFHGRKEDGLLTKFKISNLHIGCKDTQILSDNVVSKEKWQVAFCALST